MLRSRLVYAATVLAIVFTCGHVWADEHVDRPVVRVTASGTVSRAPDRVSISLSVETSGKTAQTAAKQNAQNMARVIKKLKQADLPGATISTSGFRLSPRYDQNGKNRLEPVGYTATNTVRIRVDDVSSAGQALDTAMGAGANRITGLTFGLREPDGAYDDALVHAMQAARRQARVLAEAAGARLGPVVQIQTSGGRRPVELMRARSFEHAAATPLEAGDVETVATVTASFELLHE